jgi:hypothetical protein
MIDSKKKGHIKQEDVNRYARKLRLPTPFVADFVQEHDTMDDDRLTFEEFAASVRAKEAILYTVFDEIDTGNRGYVGRRSVSVHVPQYRRLCARESKCFRPKTGVGRTGSQRESRFISSHGRGGSFPLTPSAASFAIDLPS